MPEMPPLPDHVLADDHDDLAAHWQLMGQLRSGLDEMALTGVPMALVFGAPIQEAAEADDA